MSCAGGKILFHFPDFYITNPHRVGRRKTKPALGRVSESLGAVRDNQLAINTKAHLIAFEDEREIVPFIIRLPWHGLLLCLQQGVEIGGQFFLPLQILGAARAEFFLADTGFVVPQHDTVRREDGVAKMTSVDSLQLTIHMTESEGFALAQPRKTEPQGGSAISKTGVVMNVNAMSGRLAVAGDLEDTLIEIRLFDVRRAIRRSALPAIPDRLDSIALQRRSNAS